MTEFDRHRPRIDFSRQEAHGSGVSTSGIALARPTIVIVVDTNVLLSHLEYLHALAIADFVDFAVLIIIPWVVIAELDALKTADHRHDESAPTSIAGPKTVGFVARRASRWIFDCLSSGTLTVGGESIAQMRISVPGFAPKLNDDFVLHCCLVAQKLYVGEFPGLAQKV